MRRLSLSLLALATSGLLLGGCARCGSETGTDAEGSERSAEPDVAKGPSADPMRPRLGVLMVSDLTHPGERPVDLSIELDAMVRAAFTAGGSFTSAAEDDPTACKAEVSVFYAAIENGLVAPRAEAGEVRAAIGGNLFCPRDGEVEVFKTEFTGEERFGGDHGGDAPTRARALVAKLGERTASGLAGQLMMRHASDDEVIGALASSKAVGILMEAAGEAGERKLSQAVGHLSRLAHHDESAVALRAGAALGLLGAREPDVLRALAKMTEGPDQERHLVAIHALGDIGGPEAARYLDAIGVGHPEPVLRDLAREAARRARAADEAAAPAP